MTTDKADRSWQLGSSPFEHVPLGAANIGNHGTGFEVRGNVDEGVLHRQHRSANDNNVGILHSFGKIPLRSVNSVQFLGMLLLIDVRVQTDDLNSLISALGIRR